MPTNYGNTIVFRTVRDYVNERYGVIKQFTTKIPDTITVTFDVTDSLYNKLGVKSLLKEFTTDDWMRGELDRIIAINDRIQLPNGHALEFNRKNYVSTPWYPKESDFGPNGEGTLEGWFYFEDIGEVDQLLGAFGRLEDPDDPNAIPEEDPLYCRIYIGRYRDGSLRAGYGDEWRNLYDTDIPTQQWVHLALANDGTTTYVYVDAVASGSFDSQFYWDNTENAFHLGRCNGAYPEGNALEHRPIQGKVDEVRVWKTCRTQQELSDNKDIKIDTDNPDLIRYYRIDEGVGDSVFCYVDRDFDGTLVDDSEYISEEQEPTKPQWVSGVIKYGTQEGNRISVPEYLGDFSDSLKIYWIDGITNESSESNPEDFVTIKVEVATTDNTGTSPSESDWVEQTNNTQITGVDLSKTYIWVRYSLSNSDENILPYIDWLIIFDDASSPYGLPFVTFKNEVQIPDENGQAVFSNLDPTEEGQTDSFELDVVSLNSDYVFGGLPLTGEKYFDQDTIVELFVEVNSYRFTHQYMEVAGFPSEFPVRFTHQYIEVAAVLYTYIPGYPPFDWYPCFDSTTCWGNWTVEELTGALEGQVLRFQPPNTDSDRQGLFWLGKNAKNCILQVKASVDRVQSEHTEDGIPPPDIEPYEPIVAQSSYPDTDAWENNIFESTEQTEDAKITLVSGEVEGYIITSPLDITTGYHDELEVDGVAPPKMVGSSLIEWTSTEPEGTNIEIYVAVVFPDMNGTELEDEDWEFVESGEEIPGVEQGTFFEDEYLVVKAILYTDDPEIIPTLDSLSIDIREPEVSGDYDPPAGTKYFGIFSRGSGMSDGATTCYVLCCTITTDGNRRRQLELGKYTNGSYFMLDAIYYEWDIDAFYHLKLASFGDKLEGKIWGSDEGEPLNFQLSARDSTKHGSATETLGEGFSGVFCYHSYDNGGLPNYYYDSFYFTPTVPEKRINDKLTVKVSSVRDGFESWQAQTHTLERHGYGTYYGERYGD